MPVCGIRPRVNCDVELWEVGGGFRAHPRENTIEDFDAEEEAGSEGDAEVEVGDGWDLWWIGKSGDRRRYRY